MARAPKAKPLAHVAVTRNGSTYQIQVEDEAGKKVLYELTSDLAIRLADQLDDLLAAVDLALDPAEVSTLEDPYLPQATYGYA